MKTISEKLFVLSRGERSKVFHVLYVTIIQKFSLVRQCIEYPKFSVDTINVTKDNFCNNQAHFIVFRSCIISEHLCERDSFVFLSNSFI